MTEPVDLDRLENEWSIIDGGKERKAAYRAAFAELRALREWKKNLGDPKDWFANFKDAQEHCGDPHSMLNGLWEDMENLLKRAQ